MNFGRITQNQYSFYILSNFLMGFFAWVLIGFLNESPLEYYKNQFLFLFALLWLFYPLSFYLYEQRERRKTSKTAPVWNIHNITKSRYFQYIVWSFVSGLIIWLVTGFREKPLLDYYLQHIESLFMSLWLMYPIVFYVYEERKK